jgi:hypothetical protein
MFADAPIPIPKSTIPIFLCVSVSLWWVFEASLESTREPADEGGTHGP